jgi:hypothetical protein
MIGRVPRGRDAGPRKAEQEKRVDDPGGLLTEAVHERRHGPGRDGGPCGADAVETERLPLPCRRVPLGHERHPDREGRARHAEEEPRHEQQPVAVGEAHEQRRQRGIEQHRGEQLAPAESVGQRTQRDAEQRAEHHRHGDHHGGLRVRHARPVLELRGERGQHAPRREAEQDRRRGEREVAALPGHRPLRAVATRPRLRAATRPR